MKKKSVTTTNQKTSRAVIYGKNNAARNRLLMVGTIYIVAVYLTYLLAGLGLIWFQGTLITLGLAFYLGCVVGIILIFFGALEIKDFFWYGRGLSLAIPVRFSKIIKSHASHVTGVGAIALGVFVAMVELPCTGGPYLLMTSILASNFNWLAFQYLMIYNLIFVSPLIVIVLLAAFGMKYSNMKSWKEKWKKWMRMAAGLLLVSFGAFIILYYFGYVNLEYIGVTNNGGALTLSDLTLPFVLFTAAIDSVNPCAIGVLLLMVAALVSMSRAEKSEVESEVE